MALLPVLRRANGAGMGAVFCPELATKRPVADISGSNLHNYRSAIALYSQTHPGTSDRRSWARPLLYVAVFCGDVGVANSKPDLTPPR